MQFIKDTAWQVAADIRYIRLVVCSGMNVMRTKRHGSPIVITGPFLNTILRSVSGVKTNSKGKKPSGITLLFPTTLIYVYMNIIFSWYFWLVYECKLSPVSITCANVDQYILSSYGVTKGQWVDLGCVRYWSCIACRQKKTWFKYETNCICKHPNLQ